MSITGGEVQSDVQSERKLSSGLVWALAAISLVFAGEYLQSRVHLNHDVSYFVHFARWLLEGRELGSDLLDMNLPMAWIVFMPSGLLAHLGVFSEPYAVRLVFWAYFLLSVFLSFRLLSRVAAEERAAARGWKIAFLVVATLAPGFSFGQREHVCLLFGMPYLAMAVLRARGVEKPGTAEVIAIGVLAGLGFSVKPYFLAVPALIELWLLASLGWKSLFKRPESLALAATVVLYVVAIFAFIPDYLTYTLKLTRSIYWAYDAGDFGGVIERYKDVVQSALCGALIALLTRTWSRLHTVVALAWLGYSISYFVQAKGFVYHAYPVLVCSIVFLGVSFAAGMQKMLAREPAARTPVTWAVVLASVALLAFPVKQAHDAVARWYFTYNVAWGSTGQFREAVIGIVNHFAPLKGSYFYAFSTHPFPGFPTVSYTAAEWSGRAINQLFIPAYARINEISDPLQRASVVAAGELQRNIVIEDMQRRPPSVVFAERSTSSRLGMNGRKFDDIAFYLQDPRFQKIWARYQELQPLGPLRVFVLHEDSVRSPTP